jgi:hypothetical protein
MNKRLEILESIEDVELFDEKFDEALLGYVERAGGSNFALYDKEKLFELLKDEEFQGKEGHLYFTKATMKEIEGIDNGELLVADGFNDAIIGYIQTFEGYHFVIYDTEKCIELLAKSFEEELKQENPEKTKEEIDQETHEMAVEYFYASKGHKV